MPGLEVLKGIVESGPDSGVEPELEPGRPRVLVAFLWRATGISRSATKATTQFPGQHLETRSREAVMRMRAEGVARLRQGAPDCNSIGSQNMAGTTLLRSGKTQMSADGLRYVHKTKGCQFNEGFESTSIMRSCFRCGEHRPQGDLRGTRILGVVQAVCADWEACTGRAPGGPGAESQFKR